MTTHTTPAIAGPPAHHRTTRYRNTVAAAALLATLSVATACGTADQRSASAATVPAAAASTTSPRDSGLARKMTSILEQHRADHEFVGAVLRLQEKDGAPITVTSGTKELSGDSGVVDPRIPWGIGSVTKTFVAVVVLQLAEEGRIDLDAGIDGYLPDLAGADRITPRQLLQHTSGLGEYIEQPAVLDDARRVWTPAELIAVAEAAGRTGEPGGAHAYSNTNYVVLGQIVEQVTGHPWAAEVRERILEPLRMHHTAVMTCHEAPGYGLEGDAFVDFTDRWDPSLGGAAGALKSTAKDLMTYTEALADGRLLSDASQAEWTAFIPAADYSAFGVVRHEYGLGLELYATDQVTVYGHLGSGAASSAFIAFDRESGASVVVMMNSDNPGPQALMAIEALTAARG
ncbi:serine hydrolase domain-containing protein [Modestobacter excelsi]|uniref:serine hydrolase domain-containing protein n=1 Tax=Modestobacter excelsi TaxID=2213161 RepID=UPI00110CB5D9|nr:serine hydrolase domain-containing protein [Modestobacter excelsi]